MEKRKRNILSRFLTGIWRFLDGIRRTVANVIVLALLVWLFVTVIEHAEPLASGTALVIAPKGMVVEEYSMDATDRSIAQITDNKVTETRMRDLVRGIELAAQDETIARLVIIPGYMKGIGLSKLRELRRAVDKFKQSGKEVFAYADEMWQHQYYLATLADEIWLHPEGIVYLDGYDRFRNYYKDGLEMLGVDVHLFRVGQFKSSAEPYVRNDMSSDSKQANRLWLESLWKTYLKDVAAARGLTTEGVVAMINDLSAGARRHQGNFAELALENGLVDRLATREEMRTYLKGKGGEDEDHHSFLQVSLGDYLAANPQPGVTGDHVGVVVAQGAIMGGSQPPGTVGGDSTSRLLRKARFNDKVKAVVLRVDSPGGGVFASELIRQEVNLLKRAGKPVIASMSSIATSGGYWISMNADEVWADESTITGSIGVFGMLVNYPDTLAKIGIHSDGVGTTALSGAFRADRKLDPRTGELVQQMIERVYENFITRVAHARGMTPEEVDAVAQGRVWSGAQAKERGLIDQIGGLRGAISAAATRAGMVESSEYDYVEKKLSGFERFLLDFSASTLSRLGVNWGDYLLQLPFVGDQRWRTELKLLLTKNRDPQNAYAYCFCSLD